MKIKANKYIGMGETTKVCGDLSGESVWIAKFGDLEIRGNDLTDLVSQLNNGGYLDVKPVST